MAFLTEADTCRRYVLPKLYEAGWTDEQISEQRSFTDGRIMVTGTKVKRKPQKRADYLLRYRRDFPIAVVEAKTVYNNPGDGLQQAKEYAQILRLKFAYATNGRDLLSTTSSPVATTISRIFLAPTISGYDSERVKELTRKLPNECSRPATICPESRLGITKR